MKIVYCLQGLKRSGGIERVITSKANYWAEQGHDVHLVTTDQNGERYAFALNPAVHHHDLAVNYDYDNNWGRWQRYAQLPKRRRLHLERLRKLLYTLKADVVISTFMQEADLLPKIKDGSKKILELHSSMYRRVFMYPKEQRLLRLYGYYRIWQDKRVAKQYDRFVVLTQEDKGYWGNIPEIQQIPNPQPLGDVSPSPATAPRVLAIGRYEYEKNFSTLIDVWSRLAPKYPEWSLEILGEGPLRRQLEGQVQALGLDGRVLLSPFDADVVSHYRSASIMTLLSEYEGLPMVLLEAQTMGLPIVAYTCKTGPRDIVTPEEDGLLVEQGDAEALGLALERLICDESLRLSMAIKARQNAHRFDLAVVMQSWERLIASLLKS